ncbi:MAG TPA: RNA polymerase factor sigma-32 [Kofleriaceae bacterium]|nr:RNA polymerase factor sigma-32 [Kofleriaceae bacterium]
MAERKSRGSGAGTEGAGSGSTGGAKRRRKPASKVIDVGDPADDRARRDPAAEREADGEPDGEAEADDAPDGADVDMAAGAAAVEPDEVIDSDAEEVVPVERGSSLARRDPMGLYLRETRRYPLLTPDEERALATRLVEQGDSQAARRLIEANLRLVVKIAYEYRRAHKNLLDLVQEGNIGLIQAVSKFDPYRGVKLSSYAAFWIRAYILKFILNNWRLVKIGTTQAQRKLFFNLRKEREKLEQLGFQPTTALLAEKLDVPEKEVIEMERRLAAPEASLDAPVGGGGDDDGTRTRMDYLPSEDIRPDRAVAQSEFSQLVRGKLEAFAKTLEGREQTIFRERWLTEDPLTLQEIGDRYQVSRERARQLEKRMLDRLKKYLEAELGTAVDIGALSRE